VLGRPLSSARLAIFPRPQGNVRGLVLPAAHVRHADRVAGDLLVDELGDVFNTPYGMPVDLRNDVGAGRVATAAAEQPCLGGRPAGGGVGEHHALLDRRVELLGQGRGEGAAGDSEPGVLWLAPR